MGVRESLIRSLDARCLPCFALDRERAHVAPHEMLQLVASVETATGVREEFTCGTCGQRMIRFLAKQINPPPSNVWRTERSSAPVVSAVVDPPIAAVDDRIFDPDLEDETLDEIDSVPAAVEDRIFDPALKDDTPNEADSAPATRHESDSSYAPPGL